MTGKIYIHGEILNRQDKSLDTYGYVSLATVMRQVEMQPDADSFEVHIHSVGGDVNEGFAIYNFLKNTGKPITTFSDGLVASIATIIFMAGEKRYIHNSDTFMIHNPWGGLEGEAKDLERYAAELRKWEVIMLDFYMPFLNIDREELILLLNSESYLTSEQLISMGFATGIINNFKAVAKVNLKSNEMSEQLKKEDVEGLFAGFFAKLTKALRGSIKAKIIQAATGEELDFPNLEDHETPEIGAEAKIAGNKANGEFLLPDGVIYVFVDGVLTEIKKKVEDGAEVAAMKETIKQLEGQLAAKALEYETSLKGLQTEVQTIKASLKSDYAYNGKEANQRKAQTTKFRIS